MNVFGAYKHKRDDDGLEGQHQVHAAGVPAIGSQTLCGHTDRPDITWLNTRAKVSCSGCLAVIKQVHATQPKDSA